VTMSWNSNQSGSEMQASECLRHTFYVRLISVASLVTLCSALVACHSIRGKSDVIGLYELKVGHDLIRLEVTPDERFTETIRWASGKIETRTGSWHWNNGFLNFDELWIPKSFAPDYILEADTKSSPNAPKYTEPGHWVLSAEKHWGTITLSVFPDAAISFKMVAHVSR
jgi:hypothetical protein